MIDWIHPKTVRCVAVLLGVLVVAACGSNTGPSDDKVIADSKPLFRVTDLDIENRNVIAEDRVQFRIKLNRGARTYPKGGPTPGSVRVYGKSRLTLLYRMTGAGVWQLKKVWPTEQSQRPMMDVSS